MNNFINFCVKRRGWIVGLVAILTAFFLYEARKIEVKTVFRDLLPVNHEYVKVNERFKTSFGGSNVVSIMIEVEQGDIFKIPVLSKLRNVTNSLREVDGVNSFQIISLASKKLKEIRTTADGIESSPLMWPDLPETAEDVEKLKVSVVNNPLVIGRYVSRDLKAALVTVDFYDSELDYNKIFEGIHKITESVAGDGVNVYVVGEPILYGWVNKYLPETLGLLGLCLAVLLALLLLVTRSWRGTMLPLLAGVVSAIWALGASALLGYHLEPLTIVVGFLITARSISHAVQLVSRFDDESRTTSDAVEAARAAMRDLFKPGMLGVIADAGCVIVVALTPIPFMEKIAVVGSIWVSTIAISAVILTPLMLSWKRTTGSYAHRIDVSPAIDGVLRVASGVVRSKWRYVVVVGTVSVLGISTYLAFGLTIGDANAGSPILWSSSSYNRADAAINGKFQGSDRMFLAMAGKSVDAVKSPVVLQSMFDLQKFLEAQPQIGGTLSIADVLPSVKRILREGNPRYQELGADALENGELANMLVSGSDPGDIDRFADVKFRNASITLFFRDHKGETIRTAIARVKEFAQKHPMAEGSYLLAGGLIGVLAAVNEIILAGQVEAIALGLLVVVICCTVVYRSPAAGLFFMIPVILSNAITFAYMAVAGIGMNINTLPVAALGIGLGVDYTFYIVDAIREELKTHNDLAIAIERSLFSAGRGVFITAGVLIVSVLLWVFSSLRFQAEMGLLMALWLFVSAASALFVMPAMVYVFRPKFIVGDSEAPGQASLRLGAAAA